METKSKKVNKTKTAVTEKATVKKSPLSVEVFNMEGKVVRSVELPKKLFGAEPNKNLLAQAVRVYLANQREGTASTKGRGQIRGGGAKPWRQKGTGRARAGSIRAPHWRGGGVVFGPKPRDFSLALPKKMKRAALVSALSDKQREKKIVVVDDVKFKEPKTKLAGQMLKNLNLNKKSIIVLPTLEERELRALRNLADIKVTRVAELNTYDVLNYKQLLLSLKTIEEMETFLENNK